LLIMDMKQIFQEKYQCFFLIKKANKFHKKCLLIAVIRFQNFNSVIN
jgi:hypothetical protein